ncbi:MAG TPA: hypothetical protein VFN89_05475 [Solirubrobacterales bacterium]|nr:hypothetical protein [Solirubrobacterales bacterium]
MLLQLGGELQPLETFGPEAVEEVAQAGKPLGSRPVEPAGAFAPFVEQTGISQHRQMLRNSRSGDLEMRGDLAGSHLLVTNEGEDPPPVALGESAGDLADSIAFPGLSRHRQII